MEQKQQTLSQPKWEAKVSTRLAKASPDTIWPLFRDFFGLCKWFPGLATSYGLYGENGEFGCIRYCAGSSLPPSQGSEQNGNELISWSKERLIAIDPVERTFSYEIVDCNIGFKSYVSTVKIVQGTGEDDDEINGCSIEWSFVVDPVDGWSLEDLVERYEVRLQSMAKKMEDSLYR